MSFRTRLLSFGLAAGLMTAGCTDAPSGPTLAEFDADSASANFEAMGEVFGGNLWESFGVLGELFPIGAPAAQMAFAVQSTAELAGGGARRRTPAPPRPYLDGLALQFAARPPKIPPQIPPPTYVLTTEHPQ